MKRCFSILILMLLVCPMFIKAECNYNKHTEYIKFADLVTYETEYSLGESKFTVKFYNVIKDLSLKIGKTTYTPDENDMVIINDVAEGKILDVYIYGKDGCESQVGNITVSIPYYNPYYGTEICKGYEELSLCASQFTVTRATKDMIEKTKTNYDTIIVQRTEPVQDKPVIVNVMNKVKDIFINYVLKVLLAIASAGITIAYYNNKLIKVEHGV